jgi:hypothetical protein
MGSYDALLFDFAEAADEDMAAMLACIASSPLEELHVNSALLENLSTLAQTSRPCCAAAAAALGRCTVSYLRLLQSGHVPAHNSEQSFDTCLRDVPEVLSLSTERQPHVDGVEDADDFIFEDFLPVPPLASPPPNSAPGSSHVLRVLDFLDFSSLRSNAVWTHECTPPPPFGAC